MSTDTPRLVVATENAAVEVPAAPPPTPQSWLAANLRNFIIIALVVEVGYLAYMGNEKAQDAIIVTFAALGGGIFLERAALKRPGQDA
jgi:hypothetical protein